MSRKLSLNEEMAAIDLKDRAYYDELSDEDRKSISTFVLNRWASSVTGSPEIQAYYLLSTNEKLNKNYFQIPKIHDKLNWLTLTAISPGLGKQQHQWIKAKSNEGQTKIQKFAMSIYPDISLQEAKVLESINPEVSEWRALAEQMGMSKEQIKKELGS